MMIKIKSSILLYYIKGFFKIIIQIHMASFFIIPIHIIIIYLECIYIYIFIMKAVASIILFLYFLVTIEMQICATSQYFNGQRCALCKANCICSSQYGCDSCVTGYTFDPTYTKCLACPTVTGDPYLVGCSQCCSQVTGTQFLCSNCDNTTGYVFIVGGQCISVPGCSYVNADGICLSCSNKYYYSNGLCASCDISCANCVDISYCNSCASGYFNASQFDYSLCKVCPTGCKACSSLVVCTSCIDGFHIASGLCTSSSCPLNCLNCNSTNCFLCSPGFTPIGATCTSCADPVLGSIGCSLCTTSGSSTNCNFCSIGYYLNTSNGKCISCSSLFVNSFLCTSISPLQCINDSISSIQNRYYLIGNQCIQNLNNCKSMNSDGSCQNCYFENGLYYTLNSGKCIQCWISGCNLTTLIQSIGCLCQSCLPAYQFVNNLCIACSNLHCVSCPVSTSVCTACSPYYGIYSSACALCTVSNCLNCDGDYTKCTICQVGYFLSNSSCYACQSSCASCLSNIQCSNCNSGFYLTQNLICKQLPSYCVAVDSNGDCTLCLFGFYPINGACYSCNIYAYNMALCSQFCPNYYVNLAQTTIIKGFIIMLIFCYMLLI